MIHVVRVDLRAPVPNLEIIATEVEVPVPCPPDRDAGPTVTRAGFSGAGYPYQQFEYHASLKLWPSAPRVLDARVGDIRRTPLGQTGLRDRIKLGQGHHVMAFDMQRRGAFNVLRKSATARARLSPSTLAMAR